MKRSLQRVERYPCLSKRRVELETLIEQAECVGPMLAAVDDQDAEFMACSLPDLMATCASAFQEYLPQIQEIFRT